jgi:hypothetical protein
MVDMPKKKTVKPRKRKDHPVTCRVDDAQLRDIDADRRLIEAQTGVGVSRGVYSKSALLQYARTRAMQSRLATLIESNQKLADDIARNHAEGSTLGTMVGDEAATEEAFLAMHLALRGLVS